MNGVVLLEPDVLIDRIGQMGKRADEVIPDDPIGLEARIHRIKTLLNCVPTPSGTYEARRERYIKIQGELLALAAFGGESEALSFAPAFLDTYFKLIPPEKRLFEYKLRLIDEV
ncbi:hypothetical protein HYY70_00375 [Candidatus Woesearchaeota archaeon]|nr:hypothetical protein [Candidatus Woesearchaeota archaeon]